MPQSGRNALIVGGVLAMHAAGLWALQNGLLRLPPPQIVVPVQLLAEFVVPPPPAPPPPEPVPEPVVQPPPPEPKPEPPKPRVQPRPVVKPRPVRRPTPQPLAVA